ncbi:cobalamin biosynthesis protein [Microvirga makkahensis]|uniref:Precorrin methylase n=1 Tax=Microvirga makkahensis TaxID=1128670 RepID=A0A7X3MVN1_9HYPH|nr:cobalamin biosynthesis protein [Microvirga makkahensis]MXQ13903.1 precorrin methylase [Microvirga makkahensis]
MGGDKTMIVAGVGFRRNAAADEIVALVEQALARADLMGDVLDRLATIEPLAALPAFTEAARRLSIPAVSVTGPALMEAAPRVSTHSARSLAAHGVGSVAEAAALAAGGPQSELILERIASASATCALARREIHS